MYMCVLYNISHICICIYNDDRGHANHHNNYTANNKKSYIYIDTYMHIDIHSYLFIYDHT